MTDHPGDYGPAEPEPRGHRHNFPWGYSWDPPGGSCTFCDWGKQGTLW